MSREAKEAVAKWPSLSPEEREAFRNHLGRRPEIRVYESGGAVLTINGVDRPFPSRRDAEEEFEAFIAEA
jgi:hypothetical protein